MLRAGSTCNNRAASGTFGVNRSLIGSSEVRTASTASSSMSWSPLVATITGSTTSGPTGRRESTSTTACTTAAEPSMPVLAACTVTSSSRVSSCWATKAAGTGCTPVTPWVFCAVRAVSTAQP